VFFETYDFIARNGEITRGTMQNSWQDFAHAVPELAAFGEQRLKIGPAYLATVRADGAPRVHPVTPIIGEGHLLLFMEPTSPKGQDLQRGSSYALHCSVRDNEGGEGEFRLTGHAILTGDPAMRELAAKYGYQPRPQYIFFELSVESAFSTIYPESGKAVRKHWKASADKNNAMSKTDYMLHPIGFIQ
jgi:hypothetical protein